MRFYYLTVKIDCYSSNLLKAINISNLNADKDIHIVDTKSWKQSVDNHCNRLYF